MGAKSSIEWTGSTWTPIRARSVTGAGTKVGWHCEHVSEGCRNCYAEGINRRLGTGLDFKPGNRALADIFLDEKMLLAPLRWKKPRMIFVCSMTDLVADFVLDEWIDRMFAVMALCPQHTFQVLTKRPERMREYVTSTGATPNHSAAMRVSWHVAKAGMERGLPPAGIEWPLPNVWLGVSAEDQPTANARIPFLLDTPAAKRFISAEPLLGALDLMRLDYAGNRFDALRGTCEPHSIRFPGLDWVIVGGESGRNARPMHPDWPRSLRDQCAAAEVAFFFKQWGEWAFAMTSDDPGYDDVSCTDVVPIRVRETCLLTADGRFHEPYKGRDGYPQDCRAMVRIGKKAAGARLDGREHREFPAC